MQAATDNILLLVLMATAGIFVLVVSFILIYIRNLNKMMVQRQQLQQAQLAHQKELLKTVIVSQEKERVRVGRDLHDDVGTALSNLRLIVDMSLPTENPIKHKEFVVSIKSIIDKVISDVRGISHNLSPPALGYYGLAAAVEEHCNVINRSGRLQVQLINNAQNQISKLDTPTATALYRVTEELLNNTLKHAKAAKVVIKFSANDGVLHLDYEDDGKGLNLNNKAIKGMGMQNIESRLNNIEAQYTITSSQGKGFKINVQYKIPQ